MPAYNRQLKDKDDNLIYPVLNSESIPGNAVTTAKIADGAVTSAKIGTGEVKATNIDFSTLPGNYSLSEIDTGYTWVDGSHIYKKTIEHTTGVAAGETNINHGISNIKTVINEEIIGFRSSDTTTAKLPMWSSANQISNWTVTASVVKIVATFNWTDPIYITLWYTKSS